MRIAIIGAGAAGCFAAANIKPKAGDSVTVFEKTGKAMQKIKASGGGRCNVTHSCFDIPELLTRYPRGRQLLRKSLYQFTPQHTIDWFEQRGIKLKTEADGRMFPVTDSSQTIIDCLWQQMMRNNVEVLYHKAVSSIERKEGSFNIHFPDGYAYEADKIIIATGSFPKPEQYAWLTSLGHTIQSPVPSLFTFNMPGSAVTQLMGVSVPSATVKIVGTRLKERGPLLITHWGMSGPAVLKTSAYAARELAARNYNFQIQVSWLDDVTEAELREQISGLRKEQGSQLVINKNPFNLPKRLWEHFTAQCQIKENTRWGDLAATAQNRLIEHLLRDTYDVKGKTTYKEEFVTCGGINLAEINPQTMESRLVPRLYFAGELIDADGITGGYNFQHAWSSGWIAAGSVDNA